MGEIEYQNASGTYFICKLLTSASSFTSDFQTTFLQEFRNWCDAFTKYKKDYDQWTCLKVSHSQCTVFDFLSCESIYLTFHESIFVIFLMK